MERPASPVQTGLADSENLAKLLAHLTPTTFREFIVDEFALAVPDLDPKQGPREQRAFLELVLAAQTVRLRQRMEEVAERILLLSDGAGQDVIEGCQDGIFSDEQRAAFASIRNQYERALWLYIHAPGVFKEALSARQSDVFRQSPSCYSGFMAPAHLKLTNDQAAREAFHARVARHFGCAVDAVAIQVFKRLRPDAESGDDVELIQISIHHNRPAEIIDCVQSSELVPQEVVRAASTHVTYEPGNGSLEVLSKTNEGREALAAIAADLLLSSPISGERIPIKQYDYQSLAAPRNFDVAGENIAAVKVIELGYAMAEHRSLLVKIWAKDVDDIYTVAKSLIGPTFEFRSHRLNYAKLWIRLKKSATERARTVTIIMRDENKCNVKTKREKDRALCDRLLAKWHLVREIRHDDATPLDAIAA